MDISPFDAVRDGFMLCLLGSDKPIIESLCPNKIDQTGALVNQFDGMTDVKFDYEDYKEARRQLIAMIRGNITDEDKAFLLSFEQGDPDWPLCSAGDLSKYPSVQWKLLNIHKLKRNNPGKFEEGIQKLSQFLKR